MAVITMTGNLASGAREVAALAAERLHVAYVDRELMMEASQRCGVPVGTVAAHDERYGSLRERLSGLFRSFLERSAASGADPLTGATGLEVVLSKTYADMAAEEPQLSDSVYLEAMTHIIRELAAKGDIVIVGRGSQMILAEMPHALHVLCVAPGALRAQRLAERDEIPLAEAKRRSEESERARIAFYRKFWKVNVDNPRLYDLCIDTSRLSYETATDLIELAVKAKAASAAGV